MSPSIPVTASALLLGLWLAPRPGAQLTLVDRAPELGVDLAGYGRGAAMVDLDGDGRLDLIAANGTLPSGVFRQLPDGRFEDASAPWSVTPTPGDTWTVVAADFDNDGDPDVFLGKGGFGEASSNRLLRNDIPTGGGLTDVSAASGLLQAPAHCFGSTALDYDRDGLLDIFTADRRLAGTGGELNLFRNDGGLVFTEVSAAAGLDALPGDYRHCSAGDFDNDGWTDIAVGQNGALEVLLRNQGDGTFVDVAAAAGLSPALPAFGLVLEDFDNDGWLDLYLPHYQINAVGPSQLYRNDGDGTFTDVTAGSGMTGQSDMGHNTGDIDADGHPDIYIGTGWPEGQVFDVLFLVTPDGAGGLTATDVSAASGVEAMGVTRSHGSAFGDYDDDGDIDVYVNTGGPSNKPATIESNRLLENQGNARGWIAVDLQGTASNRSGVGARLMAVTASGREVHRHLTAGKGFGNTDSPVQHFGLGDETTVQRIVIRWPSGIEQTLLAPAAFQRHAVLETGLRLTGDTVIGSTIAVETYGPAHGGSLLLVGVNETSLPLPQYGGVLRILPPFLLEIPMVLGADGTLSVPADIPDDPALVDAELLLQAWIHPPGTTEGSTLSNLVALVIGE